MAAYTVTHKQLTDNYAVLQLLTEAEIEVGASVVITDVNATFNGTFIVYALPQYAFLGVDEEGDLLFDPLVTFRIRCSTRRPLMMSHDPPLLAL
jgi:hypothetical protein